MFDNPILINLPKCIFCDMLCKSFKLNEFIDYNYHYCSHCPNSLFKSEPQILNYDGEMSMGYHSKYIIRINKNNDIIFQEIYLDKYALKQNYRYNKTEFYKFTTNFVFNASSVQYNTYSYITEMDLINIDLKTITDKDIETYILYN